LGQNIFDDVRKKYISLVFLSIYYLLLLYNIFGMQPIVRALRIDVQILGIDRQTGFRVQPIVAENV
jgi:hypothetical protein